MSSYDHVLFIGFGGPTRPEEITPFLLNVTRGIPIPEERLREVEHHYHEVGGFSPYNEYTFRLFEKLRDKLREMNVPLPLFLGMRNWDPYLKDALAEIKRRGLKRGIGVILAPHRSDASYEKYVRNVEDAKREAGAEDVDYEYLKPWFEHPGFIHAQTDEVRKVLAKIPELKRKNTPLVFSAHSIPVEMAAKSRYVEEVRASAERVAQDAGQPKWQLAWQSRSGSPRQPWLEPDICSVIRDLKSKGEDSVLVVPVGFLCDNVEVLFDLDIEARKETENLGMKYYRASTVMDHPSFVAMFTELIQELFVGFKCH